MKATKAVHISARTLGDMALAAMSVAQLTTETTGLMISLFGDKVAPTAPPNTTQDERDKLIAWLINTFPHHAQNASPEVLRFGLGQTQVQLLHYRLANIPARMEHFLKAIADKYPRDVPPGDVVALVPVVCGWRLADLVGNMTVHLCVCWGMVFDD